jgi:hypothetical protein
MVEPVGDLNRQTQNTLRNVGFPFDPLKSSNWYSGIVQAFLQGERRSAPIDSITDRTLKVLGIRTRAKRRTFLVKQITKAIRQLCNQGVIHEYTPNKIRLLHEDNSDKVQRLVAKKPQAWAVADDTSTEVDDETAAEVAALDEGGNFDVDQDREDGEEEPSPKPLTLPTLSRAQPDLDRPDCGGVDVGHSGESEGANDVIGRLLRTTTILPPAAAKANNGDAHPSIAGIRDAIEKIAPDLLVIPTGRTLRSDYKDGRLSVEVRRDGSLRISITFSATILAPVLRRVALLWHDSPIGVDEQGNPAIYRTWGADVDAHAAAHQILDDLQFIDDAMSHAGN